MGVQHRREVVMQRQCELDEAQERFNEAKESLRRACLHTYLLEYEQSSEFGGYSRHYMCQ